MNFHSPKPTAAEIMDRARKAPRPFDRLREVSRLSANRKLNERRWLAGEFLRRGHARGWQVVGNDVTPLQTPEAREARDAIAALEARIEPVSWRVLVAIVIEGASLSDCRFLVADLSKPRADNALLEHLRRALDVVAVEVDEVNARVAAVMAAQGGDELSPQS